MNLYGGSTEWCFDSWRSYTSDNQVDPWTPPRDGWGVNRGGSNYSGGGRGIYVVNSIVRQPSKVTGLDYPTDEKPVYYGLGRVVLPIPVPDAEAPGAAVSSPSANAAASSPAIAGKAIDLQARVRLPEDAYQDEKDGAWTRVARPLMAGSRSDKQLRLRRGD